MSQNTNDNYDQSTQPQHHLHSSSEALPGDRRGNMDDQNIGSDNIGQGGYAQNIGSDNLGQGGQEFGGQRQPESAFGGQQPGGLQQQGGNVGLPSGAGAGDLERGVGQTQGKHLFG